MADIEILRPEVAQALGFIERNQKYGDGSVCAGDIDVIRAELLRLARENATWLSRWNHAVNRYKRAESERDAALFANHDCIDHFNAMKADYDALRKRIDESRHVTIGAYPAHGFGYVQMICDPAKGISDKVYALVPLDDAEAAP
jgi:hypothetical protein